MNKGKEKERTRPSSTASTSSSPENKTETSNSSAMPSASLSKPNLKQKPGPNLDKPTREKSIRFEGSPPFPSHPHGDTLKDDSYKDAISSKRRLSRMKEFMYSNHSQGMGLQTLLAGRSECPPVVVTTNLQQASLNIQHEKITSENSVPNSSRRHQVDALKEDATTNSSRKQLSRMRNFMHSNHFQGVGLQLLLKGSTSFTPVNLSPYPHPHGVREQSMDKQKQEEQPVCIHPPPFISIPKEAKKNENKNEGMIYAERNAKTISEPTVESESKLVTVPEPMTASETVILPEAVTVPKFVTSSKPEIAFETEIITEPTTSSEPMTASIFAFDVAVHTPSADMSQKENNSIVKEQKSVTNVTIIASPQSFDLNTIPEGVEQVEFASETQPIKDPQIPSSYDYVDEDMKTNDSIQCNLETPSTTNVHVVDSQNRTNTIDMNTPAVSSSIPPFYPDAPSLIPPEFSENIPFDIQTIPSFASPFSSPSPSSSTSSTLCSNSPLSNAFDLNSFPLESTPLSFENASECHSSISEAPSKSLVNGFAADPSSFKILINACKEWKTKGNECMKHKNYTEAISCYSNALLFLQTPHNSHPSSTTLAVICYTNRATSEIRIKKYTSALLDYSCALQLQPDNIQIKLKVASCLLSIGEVQQAHDLSEECEEAAKSNSDNHRNVIQIKGYSLKAMEAMSDAYAISCGSDNEKWEEGLTIINHALHIYTPFSENAAQIKALLMIKMKKYEEVIRFCQSSFESAKESFLSNYNNNNDNMDANMQAEIKNSTFSFSSPSVSFSFPLPRTHLPLLHWRTIIILEALYRMGDVDAVVEYLTTSEFQELIYYSVNGDEQPSMVEKELISLSDFLSTFQNFYGLDSKALEALNDGRFDSAIAIANEALAHERISKSRKFASAFFVHRASGHAASGACLQALIDSSHAITLDNASIPAYSIRVNLYEFIDDSACAKSDLEALMQLYNQKLYEGYDQETFELQKCENRLNKVSNDIANGVRPNPYLILNSNVGDGAVEIKKRYFQLCLSIHPDKVKFLPHPDGLLWREVGEEVMETHKQIFQLLNNANENIQNQNENRQRRRRKRASTFSSRNANKNSDSNMNTNTNTNMNMNSDSNVNVNVNPNANFFQG